MSEPPLDIFEPAPRPRPRFACGTPELWLPDNCRTTPLANTATPDAASATVDATAATRFNAPRVFETAFFAVEPRREDDLRPTARFVPPLRFAAELLRFFAEAPAFRDLNVDPERRFTATDFLPALPLLLLLLLFFRAFLRAAISIIPSLSVSHKTRSSDELQQGAAGLAMPDTGPPYHRAPFAFFAGLGIRLANEAIVFGADDWKASPCLVHCPKVEPAGQRCMSLIRG